MPRVLVTGAGGLIGRHAVSALEAGGATVLPWQGDLLDPEARARMPGADILLHLAWVTAHGRFWTAPENTGWQEASIDLFHRFRDAGGRRIVGAGTCAEYDWSRVGPAPVPEDAPLAPHTLYGQTKAATAEALPGLGLSAAWGRVFLLYGPGEAPARLIPAMLNAVRTGVPLDCGPGGLVRDVSAAEDVGRAFATLALRPVEGAVNIGTGTGVALGEIGALVERLGGVSGLIRFDRRPAGAGEPPVLVADTARLTGEAGFSPAITLEAGLARYLGL